MNILVIGANGYVASRLVRELIRQGHHVRGVVRSLDKGAELEKQGMELRVGDIARLEDIRAVAQDIEIIFNLAGYCRAEPKVMQFALVDGTRNLLQVIDHSVLQKYIWTSSVAVYGHPKANVKLTEASPLKPNYAVGRATIDVEKLVRGELPAVTVRVSSVYGPGRDYIEGLQAGRVRILNTGANWQSRIHVDDLVQVLLAAMERAPNGETYLAGDDLPTTAKAFFDELAEALHVAPPLPLEMRAALAFGVATRAMNWLAGQPQYQLNENVVGLLTGNYFCVNDKLKQGLGIQLKYPTFREAYEEWLVGKK